jgi:plastocyanin
MVGSIEVVADDVAIPSPIEAAAAAADQVTAQLNQAGATIEPALLKVPATSADGKLAIDAGTGAYGRVSIQAFSAPLAVVNVGDSVTWTIPTDSVEPHTVTSTNFGGEEFTIKPQTNGPPLIVLGEVFAPGPKTDIGADDSFNSGFLTPGQSFSLSFTAPGVHPYVCRLHDGMFGVVVVQPKM